MREREEINIGFSVNEKYIPYLCVAINSLKNVITCKYYYTIYILHEKIAFEVQQRVKDWIGQDMDINFVDISSYISGREFFVGGEKGKNYLTKETYFRLLLPEILPNISKMFYFDADIIFKNDIEKLFSLNIGDDLLGAVPDIADNWKCQEQPSLSKYRKEELRLPNAGDYFNAGVLILNLEKFRELYAPGDLLFIASEKMWKKHDQDVLNSVCKGRYYKLDMRWNLIELPYDILTRSYGEATVMEYKNAVKNPGIIHYAARKPWMNKHVAFSKDFWENVVGTPWFNYIVDAYIENVLADIEVLTQCVEKELQNERIGFRFIMNSLKKWLKIKLKGGCKK